LVITKAGIVAIVMISIISAINGAASPVYKQLPDHRGGYISGIYSPETGTLAFTVADDFQLNKPAKIVCIKWWGSESFTENFTIMLFDDNAGEPGNLLYRLDGFAPTKSQTGGWVDRRGHGGVGNFPEFEFNFNLPTSFVAGANTRYWLSIVNVNVDGWSWEASGPGTVQRSLESSLNGPWSWEPNLDNMAFQLSGNWN